MFSPIMRIHEPHFDETAALYIIWASNPWTRMESLAAGSFTAMKAAWDALQSERPQDRLTLQHGARVLRERPPLR